MPKNKKRSNAKKTVERPAPTRRLSAEFNLLETLALSWSFLLAIAYVAIALFSCYYISNHLNYAQMDLAGHMASASWFSRGYYHQYQDANFLGYVQGLFYPPLEDFLLSTITWLSQSSFVYGFKLYLGLIGSLFIASIYFVGSIFTNVLARNLWRTLCIGVLFIVKGDLLYFQGMSLIDLHVTGLTSQILGGIFFFWFIRELFGPFRLGRLTIFLSLALLSHIVVSLVCLFLVFLFFVSDKEKRKPLFVAGTISLLISAFYFFPFVAYQKHLTSSRIMGENTQMFLLVLLSMNLVFFWGARRQAQIAMLSAFLLVLPVVLGRTWPATEAFMPKFHFYRFVVFGLYLSIFSSALLIESKFYQNWTSRLGMARKVLAAAWIIFAIYFGQYKFSKFWPNPRAWEFLPVSTRFDAIGPTTFDEFGRYWILGTHRSADFGIDTLLQSSDPEFRSAKGLYWESSKNNLLLSSYLATLLSSPVVLDHFYYWGYTCEIQRCLMDQFFRDYNVKGVMVDRQVALPYIADDRRSCYKEIFEKGETMSYRLKKMGEFYISGTSMNNYHLVPKPVIDPKSPPPAPTNQPIEAMTISGLLPYQKNNQGFFSDYMKSAFSACQSGRLTSTVMVEEEIFRAIVKDFNGLGATNLLAPETLAGPMTLKRASAGRYELNIPSERPLLVRIKLNFLPFFKLYREDGSEAPLYNGFPSMIAIGKGKMTLEFHRSLLMKVSYAISAITLVLVLLFWKAIRKKV